MFHFQSRTRPQFVVLPPSGSAIPAALRRTEFDTHRHQSLLASMQRLRGKVYLGDGAIRPEDLTVDGRHQMADDAAAWHVLSLAPDGRVKACLRYLDEGRSYGFRNLWVSHTALARCPKAGWKLRMAVESKLASARATHMGFGSVGGWAASPEDRRTMEPVAIILAMYGLLELLGSSLGVATATCRHHSASILRKIGLHPLVWSGDELPSYYDPRYGCQMEVLEFDSRLPNPKYRAAVRDFRDSLIHAPVICRQEAQTPLVPAINHQPAGRFMAAVA